VTKIYAFIELKPEYYFDSDESGARASWVSSRKQTGNEYGKEHRQLVGMEVGTYSEGIVVQLYLSKVRVEIPAVAIYSKKVKKFSDLELALQVMFEKGKGILF
jgi:hypothetical protein